MKKKFGKLLAVAALALAGAAPAWAGCQRVLFCDSTGDCQFAYLCCNESGYCMLWFQEN